MAMIVHRVWRTGHRARHGAEEVPDRAAARRHRSRSGGEGDTPLAALKIIFRMPTVLCLMASLMCANFVAVVLLSCMPKFLYDKFGMNLATAGLTATIFVQLASMIASPPRRMARRLAARAVGGGTARRAGTGTGVRCTVCGGLRTDELSRMVDRGADRVGIFQMAV